VRIREAPAAFHEQRGRTALTGKKVYESPSERLQEQQELTQSARIKNHKPSSGTAYSKSKDFKVIYSRRIDSEDIHGFADHSSKYAPYPYSKKKLEDLDINQADSSDWCKLPGIGIKLASRIVHFRDKLGGFYEVDQLSETFGLPDSTFQVIRPYMHIGSTELQKINLNDTKQETLQMHPYIRWKLAKIIIQYRVQHGGFKSVAELQQLAQMDPEKFKKLEPYLEVKQE
jgi:DNA uptake protein ComE-like DNA-binding protein